MKTLCVIAMLLLLTGACGTGGMGASMSVVEVASEPDRSDDPDVVVDELDVLMAELIPEQTGGDSFLEADVSNEEMGGEVWIPLDVTEDTWEPLDASPDLNEGDELGTSDPDVDNPILSPPLTIKLQRDNGEVCIGTLTSPPPFGGIGSNTTTKWYFLAPLAVERFYEDHIIAGAPAWDKDAPTSGMYNEELCAKFLPEFVCEDKPCEYFCALQWDCTEIYCEGPWESPLGCNCAVYHESTFLTLNPLEGLGVEGTLEELPHGKYLILMTSAGPYDGSKSCEAEDCGYEDPEWWDKCPEDWWTEEVGDHVYHLTFTAECNGVEYQTTWYPDPREHRMFAAFEIEMPSGIVTVLNEEYKKVSFNDDGVLWTEWHPL